MLFFIICLFGPIAVILSIYAVVRIFGGRAAVDKPMGHFHWSIQILWLILFLYPIASLVFGVWGLVNVSSEENTWEYRWEPQQAEIVQVGDRQVIVLSVEGESVELDAENHDVLGKLSEVWYQVEVIEREWWFLEERIVSYELISFGSER